MTTFWNDNPGTWDEALKQSLSEVKRLEIELASAYGIVAALKQLKVESLLRKKGIYHYEKCKAYLPENKSSVFVYYGLRISARDGSCSLKFKQILASGKISSSKYFTFVIASDFEQIRWIDR